MATTYGQFYESCAAFCGQQWVTALAAFSAVGAGSPAPAEIKANLLAQQNPMHVFAYLAPDGRVTTLHRFSSLVTRMGQPATPWDNKILAMEMDWTLMGVKTVEVPNDIFARSPVIPVPLDAAEVLNYFATNPAADHLPPYLAGQVGTEQVVLRWCTFVPHFLAPYFLSER